MIPAIAPDQTEVCAICQVTSSVVPEFNDHHLTKRSAGGLHEGTIRICIQCHNHAHQYGWQIADAVDYLFVLDKAGKLLVKRWKPPEDWDQHAVVAAVENGAEALDRIAQRFRYLDSEGVEAVAAALGNLSRVSWIAVARLVDVAHLGTPYGSKGAAITAVVNLLGLERRTAYYYREALKAYDEHAELVQPLHDLLSPGHLLELAKAPNPTAAAELLADRLTAMPQYSVGEYRAELKAGKTSDDAPPPMHTCECGHRHIDRRTIT